MNEKVLVPHTWAVEEIDGGPAGSDDFWKCTDCGASGGVSTTMTFPSLRPNEKGDRTTEAKIEARHPRPFYTSDVLHISMLPEDCDESKVIIQKALADLKECPDCRRKIKIYPMGGTYCSRYCYDHPPEKRPTSRSLGDWAILPCKGCGQSVESEYKGEWFFWCKHCWKYEVGRVAVELLYETVLQIPFVGAEMSSDLATRKQKEAEELYKKIEDFLTEVRSRS